MLFLNEQLRSLSGFLRAIEPTAKDICQQQESQNGHRESGKRQINYAHLKGTNGQMPPGEEWISLLLDTQLYCASLQGQCLEQRLEDGIADLDHDFAHWKFALRPQTS